MVHLQAFLCNKACQPFCASEPIPVSNGWLSAFVYTQEHIIDLLNGRVFEFHVGSTSRYN